MKEESIPAGEVIKIDPDGKYVFVFPMRLTDQEIVDYRNIMDRWWNGGTDSPFLVIDGGVQVVRLERDGEEKSKAKGKAKATTKAKEKR